MGDPAAQVGDVAHDADRAPARPQPVEHGQHLFQAVVVEAAEALVDEQGAEVETTGLLAHGVGQTERQGQRGHERLTAGEGRGVTHPPGPLVEHAQAEPRASTPGGPLVGVLQQVATPAHDGEPFVGQGRDLLESGREHVRREAHAQRVLRPGATRRVGEVAHALVVVLRGGHGGSGREDLGDNAFEQAQPAGRVVTGRLGLEQGCSGCGFRLAQGLDVDLVTAERRSDLRIVEGGSRGGRLLLVVRDLDTQGRHLRRRTQGRPHVRGVAQPCRGESVVDDVRGHCRPGDGLGERRAGCAVVAEQPGEGCVCSRATTVAGAQLVGCAKLLGARCRGGILVVELAEDGRRRPRLRQQGRERVLVGLQSGADRGEAGEEHRVFLRVGVRCGELGAALRLLRLQRGSGRALQTCEPGRGRGGEHLDLALDGGQQAASLVDPVLGSRDLVTRDGVGGDGEVGVLSAAAHRARIAVGEAGGQLGSHAVEPALTQVEQLGSGIEQGLVQAAPARC